MFKILVVEDDKELNASVCSFLRRNGFDTNGCLSADAAYDALCDMVFDLIISDIMMPGVDGYEFVKTVRETNKEIPILFMTARDDFESKRTGYQIGIDDYMVKPVDLNEMLLHIHALLRRANIASSKKLTVGSFTMDIEEYTATNKGTVIPLTVREFNILFKLLSYPRKTFSRAQLMEEFWKGETTSNLRAVDVYMTRIRDKISDCTDFEIRTIYGLGYKAVLI